MKKLKITPLSKIKMEAGLIFHPKWFDNEVKKALIAKGFDLDKPLFRTEESDGSLTYYQEEDSEEMIKNIKFFSAIVLGIIATVLILGFIVSLI